MFSVNMTRNIYARTRYHKFNYLNNSFQHRFCRFWHLLSGYIESVSTRNTKYISFKSCLFFFFSRFSLFNDSKCHKYFTRYSCKHISLEKLFKGYKFTLLKSFFRMACGPFPLLLMKHPPPLYFFFLFSLTQKQKQIYK